MFLNRGKHSYQKPLLTEIEKSNIVLVYIWTRSDLNKIRNDWRIKKFKSYILAEFSDMAISLRKQQRNGSKWNCLNFELFP